jgi:aspartate aminotransferase
VLLKHPQVLIATDDMYEHILWRSEPFSNLINVCPALYERIIVLHGVSKTYAMTGWRIGFNAGPKELIQAMSNIQSQSTSNACSISQKAALAALTGDQSCIPPMVAAFKQRTEFVVQALGEIDGVRSTMPDGTFYVFPYVQPLAERLGLKDDLAFTEMLLERARVAVVPGSAFGAPGYIRISTATSLENLQESMRRLRGVVA